VPTALLKSVLSHFYKAGMPNGTKNHFKTVFKKNKQKSPSTAWVERLFL
jgi:hypothetical protein